MVKPIRDLRDIRARLVAEGWRLDRADGDHEIWKRPGGGGRVVVPKGRGDIAHGTAMSIMKQAGWRP
jgi:predicted RNA binding protein YcfA (HicA-like mRNA interferase family)